MNTLLLTSLFRLNLPSPFLAAATADITPKIDSFLAFIQSLLILPALALVLYAAWMFHENRIRDAAMALAGALLLALAVPIVRAIFGF